MGFSCTPQLKGLVRGEPKAKAKHRANGRAIAGEMGENDGKRQTESETYDETRTCMNHYEGYKNGYEAWDYIEDRANNYRVKSVNKKGETFERGLRADAVVGCAIIFNPPEEVCVNWTDEQYKKFYDDSWDFLCQFQPDIFSDKNVVMTAEHYDEGLDPDGKSRHQHRLIEPRDRNDRYCGNLIDPKLLAGINKSYPQFMRKRGWDMDDLDTTDWKKYKEDSDYRAERKAKAKNNGRSVNKYAKHKALEDVKKQAKDKQDMADLAEKLIEYERNLDDRKRKLDEREMLLHNKSIHLDMQEDDLDTRETRLKAREDDLQTKQDNFTLERENWLETKNTTLEDERKKMQDEQKEQALNYLRRKKKLDEENEIYKAELKAESDRQMQEYKQTLQQRVQDFCEQVKKDMTAPYKRTGRAIPEEYEKMFKQMQEKADGLELN